MRSLPEYLAYFTARWDDQRLYGWYLHHCEKGCPEYAGILAAILYQRQLAAWHASREPEVTAIRVHQFKEERP